MTIFNKYFVLLYSPDLNDLVVFPIQFKTEKFGLKLNIQKTKTMSSGLITSWQIDGETMETVTDFILGAKKSLKMVVAVMKLKDASWKKKVMINLDSILKSRDIANKGLSSQSNDFSSSHV